MTRLFSLPLDGTSLACTALQLVLAGRPSLQRRLTHRAAGHAALQEPELYLLRHEVSAVSREAPANKPQHLCVVGHGRAKRFLGLRHVAVEKVLDGLVTEDRHHGGFVRVLVAVLGKRRNEVIAVFKVILELESVADVRRSLAQ